MIEHNMNSQVTATNRFETVDDDFGSSQTSTHDVTSALSNWAKDQKIDKKGLSPISLVASPVSSLQAEEMAPDGEKDPS